MPRIVAHPAAWRRGTGGGTGWVTALSPARPIRSASRCGRDEGVPQSRDPPRAPARPASARGAASWTRTGCLAQECATAPLGVRRRCYHARNGGSGALRAAERLHGLRALRALLRRVLGRPRADPDRVLARADVGRHDPLRQRALAARGSGAPAQRPAGAVHRRGPARAPAGSGRAVAPALRSRRRRRALPQIRAGRPEGRVLVRALSGGVLRVVLLPQELRPAGLSLAPPRRRHRAGARRDDPEIRRAHARSSVVAGRAARDGAGHPDRRRLLLARACRQGARARRRLEPDPGAALAEKAEDDRAARARSDLSRSRPDLLGNRQTGAGRVSVSRLVTLNRRKP